jgi:TrmH family RNA methyltransferase
MFQKISIILGIGISFQFKDKKLISKSLIKLMQSLRLQKYRESHGLFIAEGPKIVGEFLSSAFRIKTMFATESFPEPDRLADARIEFVRISQKELERISLLKTPNQVIALIRMPECRNTPPEVTGNLVLVLDRISDPGNLGSIIRTADWFGIKEIICSKDCVDLYNPKVVQATMGSMARVNVTYWPLEDYLPQMQGKVPVYGASLDGVNLYSQKFAETAIIVIGSESHGISENLKPYISSMITIPGVREQKNAGAESLNASVAAALICSEFRRQHGFLSG